MSVDPNPYEPPRASLSPPSDTPRRGPLLGTVLAGLCGLIGVVGLAIPCLLLASIVFYLDIEGLHFSATVYAIVCMVALIGCAGATLIHAARSFSRGRWPQAWMFAVLGSALMAVSVFATWAGWFVQTLR